MSGKSQTIGDFNFNDGLQLDRENRIVPYFPDFAHNRPRR
jgi:hypothetical protein